MHRPAKLFDQRRHTLRQSAGLACQGDTQPFLADGGATNSGNLNIIPNSWAGHQRFPVVAARNPPRPLRVTSSVAVGANAHAHAGSAEADTATFFIATAFIATALDITLTRGVCVRIIGLPDDDTAFTTFAPATAIFIADHANVLNVALRCD